MPTKLQATAAKEADAKKKAKATGLIASALAMLGIGDAPTAGRMKKVTETHKHVKVEEEEGGSDSEEEESDAEEEEGSTGSTMSTEDSTGTSKSEEEEEEEEEEGKAEEEDAEGEEGDPAKAKRAKKSEEEEEKALARAVGRALNSPSVHQAFLAALPRKQRDAGAIYSPHRLAALAKRATNTRTTYGALNALSSLKKIGAKADRKVLAKQASLETRVAKVEGARRKDRVEAIVDVAKTKGVAGATTKDGRAQLRDFGMKHGATALSRHLAAMPVVARTSAKTPRGDERPGAPTASEQEAAMKSALTAGITDPKEKAAILEIYEEKRKANLNGASTGTET